MSPALLFGLGAGIPAILAEYLYKQPWATAVPWYYNLWIWAPLQLCIGYCIYRLVNIPGMSILEAFVVFAFCTSLLRIVLSAFILKQDISTGAWVAFGLIVLANIIKTFWEYIANVIAR